MTFSPRWNIHLVLRTIQTLFTIITLCLYASTFTHTTSPSYIYALVCCLLTLLTLLIYALPKTPCQKFFLWDFCIAVLWAALAGVFGMVYLEPDGRDRSSEWIEGEQGRMKVAVVLDLVVMVCWVVTAGWECVRCVKMMLRARRIRKEARKMESTLEGQEQGLIEQDQDDQLNNKKELDQGEKAEKELLKYERKLETRN